MNAERYLGDFSAAGGSYSIGLTCHHCNVSWTGCAAAAECPECGSPKGYHRENYNECFCELCKPPTPTQETETGGQR